jgi:acyl transferase domain-containing protein/acyl carrier protein
MIAIVGMAGRFPGATNLEKYWRNLVDGVDAVSRFPGADESNWIDPARSRRSNYVAAKGLLEDCELFDPLFFGISQREAEIMDPQQRLMLECCWEAIETAGYADFDSRQVGIVCGCHQNTYLLQNVIGRFDELKQLGESLIFQNNQLDQLATRVAYKCGFTGPSYTIQSACSTSLVAVHQACQSLLQGEADMMLAGAVCVTCPPISGYLYEPEGIMAPDGVCRPFDASANGTVFGNGVGVVVLKRLEDAVADCDTICAVIRGSAINNDGSRKVGYAAPSVVGQASVIAEALAMAGVSPSSIGLIEAHGTGTRVGDPIEFEALNEVFRTATDKIGYCALGSVKSNIGHLDVAAGMAGLIKTVLCLQRQEIPPTLHFKTPNPAIDLNSSPFYVNQTTIPWVSDDEPRRAGVSAFGVGGTNAHLVLEQPPLAEPSAIGRETTILLLSAKEPTAVSTAAKHLARTLRDRSDLNLSDISYTLAIGRRQFSFRLAVAVPTKDRLRAAEMLEAAVQSIAPLQRLAATRDVVFVFSGESGRRLDHAWRMAETEPTFARSFQECDRIIRQIAGKSLNLLRTASSSAGGDFLRPLASFAIEYALAQVWLSFGVKPVAVLGNGAGEYVAACVAGALSLSDALGLVFKLTELTATNPGNEIPHEVKELQENLISHDIISTPLDGFKGLETTSLSVEEVTDALAGVIFATPTLQFISTRAGRLLVDSDFTQVEWTNRIRAPVGLGQTLRDPSIERPVALLEIGLVHGSSKLADLCDLRDTDSFVQSSRIDKLSFEEPLAHLSESLANLWSAGVKIDWTRYFSNERRRRVALPTYSFERQRCWIEPITRAAMGTADSIPADIPRCYSPIWRRSREGLSHSVDGVVGKRTWLVLADRTPLSEQMIQSLTDSGQIVSIVYPGQSFVALSRDLYEVDPVNPKDYERLLQHLRGLTRTPTRVLHLWYWSAPSIPVDSLEAERVTNLGAPCLSALARALIDQNVVQPIRLLAAVPELHDILGNETLSPLAATIVGVCRVISQELAHCRCCVVDLGRLNNEAEVVAGVANLLTEIEGNFEEPLVARRGPYRMLPEFLPLQSPTVSTPRCRLADGGVYLITGGLGGIGRTVAMWLARSHRARLALVQRTPLPRRSEWKTILATDLESPVAQRIRAVEKMEEDGGEVLIVAADVEKEVDVVRSIRQIHERFGPINGVFHAAGIAGNRLLGSASPSDTRLVLGPKVLGTLALDRLLDESPLEFFVLFSSVNALAGGIGQASYCAGNAFLDAFAHSRQIARGKRTMSINWPAWRVIGMAAEAAPKYLENWRRESLEFGLDPQEGIALLEQLLEGEEPQIVVSKRPLREELARYIGLNSVQFTALTSGVTQSRPSLASAYVAPRSDLEGTLAAIWHEILGVEPIGIEDDFFELGGHSLIGMQIIARIKLELGVEPSVLDLFERSTIATLAQTIEELMSEK